MPTPELDDLGSGPYLTIGAVSDATGVSVAGLRAWEHRYDFPKPERLPSGHRRYNATHVEQVLQVMRDRDAGMLLDAAISRVRAASVGSGSSIFGGVRRRRPDLPVHVLSKRAMLAVSHAIEDECCARSSRPVLIGAFQRERFYRQSERRWVEFARTAESTTVFAAFAKTTTPPRRPAEVALAHDAPLLREWAVVCDATDGAAVLAGVERMRLSPAEPRQFEAVWSVEPDVVRQASLTAFALARQLGAPVDPPIALPPPADHTAVLRTAAAITQRVVANLDA